MRHVAICRRHESAPESFTIATRTSGEDGWQWAERAGLVSQFESLVRLAISEIGVATGDAMPNLTITTRDLQSVLQQPPLDDAAELLNVQPGVGLVALMPIRLEEPRTKYERWATISRSTHGLSGAPILSAVNVSPNIFIARLWSDRLLDQFNAGETVHGFAGPTFKKFAKQPSYRRNEIWIRPQWQAAAILPDVFPPEKPRPAMLSPEQLADKEKRSEANRMKRQTESHWASKGYSYNPKTLAWSPRK